MATSRLTSFFWVLLAMIESAVPYSRTSCRHCTLLKATYAFDGSFVTPGDDGFGGKGLLARKAFETGEVLCTVPMSFCILARRDGIISNLVGQSDACFDIFGDLREATPQEQEMAGLTWDLRLAVGLLEATSGAALHREANFWDGYLRALPKPYSVTLPFCMHETVLRQTQDADLIYNAKAQQERLALFAQGRLFDSHRVTFDVEDNKLQKHVPPPLSWAFAMVRSRCFQISPDWFATVPVIEIANHSPDPNAQFIVLGDSLDNAACVLKALRPIKATEDIRISYDASSESSYSNRRLFTQYGFVINGNPVADEEILRGTTQQHGSKDGVPEQNATIEVAIDFLVDAAISLLANGPPHLTCRVEPISRALGSYIRNLPSDAIETSASLLFEQITERIFHLEAIFATSLDADAALLVELESSSSVLVAENGSSSENGDLVLNRLQYMACVRYRMDRKASILTAKAMVELAMQKSRSD